MSSIGPRHKCNVNRRHDLTVQPETNDENELATFKWIASLVDTPVAMDRHVVDGTETSPFIPRDYPPSHDTVPLVLLGVVGPWYKHKQVILVATVIQSQLMCRV